MDFISLFCFNPTQKPFMKTKREFSSERFPPLLRHSPVFALEKLAELAWGRESESVGNLRYVQLSVLFKQRGRVSEPHGKDEFSRSLSGYGFYFGEQLGP